MERNLQAHQMERPIEQQGQEIVVYSDHAWARFRAISLAGCWLFALIGSTLLLKSYFSFNAFFMTGAGMSIAIITFLLVMICLIVLSVNADFEFGDPGDNPIFLVLVMILSFIIGSWVVWKVIRRWQENKPTLLVNHEEIIVDYMLRGSNILIPWSEIEAIYTYNVGSYARLCIRPRHQPWQNRHIDASTGASINIPQRYLDQPVTRIIEQIQSSYASALQIHEIKISSRCLHWSKSS